MLVRNDMELLKAGIRYEEPFQCLTLLCRDFSKVCAPNKVQGKGTFDSDLENLLARYLIEMKQKNIFRGDNTMSSLIKTLIAT